MGCGIVYNGKTMLLFGGKNDTTFFKNTWEWDGKHWTQRQDIGPAARAFVWRVGIVRTLFLARVVTSA